MRNLSIYFVVAACGLLTSCANEYPCGDDAIVQEYYVHRYGVAVPEEDWMERGQHGQIVSIQKNGVQVSKSYEGGILEGDTSYTFPHSTTIEKVESYQKEKKTQETAFYQSGAPHQQIKFQDDQSKIITLWYENGTPKAVEEYDPKGLLLKGEYFDLRHNKEAAVDNYEGSRIARDAFGQILTKDTIKGGMLDSRATFYPNGTPKETISYQNGIVSGIKKTYFPDGEPNTIESWENGKHTGVTTFYKNGAKYAEVTFVDGKKNGVERRFRDGDKLVEETYWKDNQRHGSSTSYVGTNEHVDWYYQGIPTTQANFVIWSNAVFQ